MNSTTRTQKDVPAYMAHYVIRTNRYDEVVSWHKAFFQADVVFSNDFITFLAFDDEHHRIAIGRLPGLTDHDPQASGIDHIAFSYRTLEELLHTYRRLKGIDILPFMCLNHGPTTSLYYKDPDGAQIEIQVDNYATSTEARAFFHSETFANNPIGVPFDPDLLCDKLDQGVPVGELLKQGSAPVADSQKH